MSRLRYEPCPKCVQNGRDTRGDNLVRYPDSSGHCFSCSYHEFTPFTSRFSIIKEVNGPKSLLPSDFTREIPRHALQWLLQWELPYSYWKENIGYSPKEERLVFRVGSPNLAFSIGRYCPAGESSERPRKWYVWGDSHRHAEVIGGGKDGPIILVEDLISAHKVGQVCEAIPLFGTVVHSPVIYHLLNSSKRVYIWLDKDQEQPVKKKAIQLSSLIDRSVDIIVTDKDPKTYSIDKLKEIINA